MNYIRIFRQRVPASLVLLAILEYLLMVLAVHFGYALRFSIAPTNWEAMSEVQLRAHAYATVNLLCILAMGTYLPAREGLTGSMLRTVVAIFLIGTAILSAGFYIFPSLELYLGRGVMAIAGVISLVGIALLRFVFYRLSDLSALRWRIMVVGAGVRAQRLSALIDEMAPADIDLTGFCPVQGAAATGQHHIAPDRLLARTGTLLEMCRQHDIQEIVVAVDERRRTDGGNGGFPLEELLDCKLGGIAVLDDTGFLERQTGKLDIRAVSPGWLVFSDGFSYSPLRDFFERALDLTASLALLLLSSPLMLLAVIAIKLEDGLRAPIIYSQERVGRGGKVFRVHKFRSMRTDAEKDGKAVWAAKNDSRVTRVGAFIRNTRIDELPQIFNVIKGEMGFVGPRPERPQFVDQLAEQIPYFRERHRVKPGITGWAQLCYPYGASAEDAEEKLKYDLYYIKNHSVFFDLYILVRTVEVILLGKGVR